MFYEVPVVTIGVCVCRSTVCGIYYPHKYQYILYITVYAVGGRPVKIGELLGGVRWVGQGGGGGGRVG